jgi:hypothetical protein
MTKDMAGCLYLLVFIVATIAIGTGISWLALYLASLVIPAIEATLWNALILFGVLWLIKAIIN